LAEAARKQAYGTLFAVALLQGLCGGLALAFPGRTAPAPSPVGLFEFGLIEAFGGAVLFAGLGAWAHTRPLLASALGLGLAVLLAALAFLVHVTLGVGPVPLSFLIRVVIVGLLVRAVFTTARARPADDLL
jgi:hypothetical protein